MTHKITTNRLLRVFVISAVIILLLSIAYALGHSGPSRPAPPSRQEKLAALMPAAPPDFKLVSEGYDPKSGCFDKCGYQYRLYSYVDNATFCKDMFETIGSDKRGLELASYRVDELDETSCNQLLEDLLKNRTDMGLEIQATLRQTINHKEVESKQVLAKIAVNPVDKTMEYRITQLRENDTIVDQSPH